MANFNDVHRSAMQAADRQLHPGEGWRVAVREPLVFAELGSEAMSETVKLVTFIVTNSGRLEPATPADREVIADWNKRHRDTPDDRFDFPFGP